MLYHRQFRAMSFDRIVSVATFPLDALIADCTSDTRSLPDFIRYLASIPVLTFVTNRVLYINHISVPTAIMSKSLYLVYPSIKYKH